MTGDLRRMHRLIVFLVAIVLAQAAVAGQQPLPTPSAVPIASSLGIAFVEGSASSLLVQRDGKTYLVDVASHTIREVDPAAQTAAVRPPDASTAQNQVSPDEQQPTNRNFYVPGNDRLFTLPTGARLSRHGMLVSFTHRFPYDASFTGRARGNTLLGLDTIAIPAFGFQYGFTSRLSVSVYRAPSLIERPIELMASYQLAEERLGNPLNASVRISVDGQNDFERNFTTNLEAIVSRSMTSRAALFLVPTYSYHNRPVLGVNSITVPPPQQPCAQALANGLPASFRARPCANTFSLGVGLALDIRPTVALIAEVNPTLANAEDLGIHRPPYSFAIQKKIWRHAFTFGFTTAPGTTVAQRAGTRATFVQNPSADKPSGLFVGFNLSRQLR